MEVCHDQDLAAVHFSRISEGVVPEANTHIRLKVHEDGRNLLYDSSFKPLGELNERFPLGMSGLLVSKISNNTNQIEFAYYGEKLE